MKWIKRLFRKTQPKVVGVSVEQSLKTIPSLKIGDTYKGLKVVNITPHQDIPNSVYYEFEDGSFCRDIRLN